MKQGQLHKTQKLADPLFSACYIVTKPRHKSLKNKNLLKLKAIIFMCAKFNF